MERPGGLDPGFFATLHVNYLDNWFPKASTSFPHSFSKGTSPGYDRTFRNVPKAEVCASAFTSWLGVLQSLREPSYRQLQN